MAFVISTLKFVFISLNIVTLVSAAFYFGFGIFLAISQGDALGFGLKPVAFASLGGGAAAFLFSILGFSAISGRRRVFLNFVSFLLLCLSIFEFGFAIVTTIRHSKVEEYMSVAWDDLNEASKIAFEAAYSCCGFKDPSDRTACPADKLGTAQACAAQLSGRQSKILVWLIAGAVATGVITLVNYIVARCLSRLYKKAQLRFKQQQKQQRIKSTLNQSDKSKDVENSPKADSDLKKDTILKTSPLKSNAYKGNFNFISDVFKPVPKPIKNNDRLARSSGSNLTYEEIATKYRSNKN